ncbi:MAG TPA: hypothetical protein PK441_07450 [Burkholderiaceae bacterium]|uniref:hypothetical protein n=1 Tax=Candidatus Skiveiella danica TaxID=3386177 RepID=UPI001D2DA554|nr:hypothetical protein [Comamonadaceae bacterium]MBK8361620.1 hypothetical protein [Comamonadaceae bacterium]MBK9198967.1 hypothetical protein [Betaproteobacteria bacterium]MBK9986070.1 hypothetical protein [Betaproteobacteria bacterium]HOF30663.1 hypothetical protein [Burkholderiaceae bacterium]
MFNKFTLAAAALMASACVGAQQFPVADNVAAKVVQKYQSMTCEQLWAQKAQPKSAEEQRVIGILQQNPQMRAEFINRIAGVVVNKMFDCGMIP